MQLRMALLLLLSVFKVPIRHIENLQEVERECSNSQVYLGKKLKDQCSVEHPVGSPIRGTEQSWDTGEQM